MQWLVRHITMTLQKGQRLIIIFGEPKPGVAEIEMEEDLGVSAVIKEPNEELLEWLTSQIWDSQFHQELCLGYHHRVPLSSLGISQHCCPLPYHIPCV